MFKKDAVSIQIHNILIPNVVPSKRCRESKNFSPNFSIAQLLSATKFGAQKQEIDRSSSVNELKRLISLHAVVKTGAKL